MAGGMGLRYHEAHQRFAHGKVIAMLDQALVWNTDINLQVTSLTARLRDFAGIGDRAATLHVSDLWGSSDPADVILAAHQWVLDGEHMSYEAAVRSTRLRFELAPLVDALGTVVGVCGRAVELQAASIDPRAMNAAERTIGMGTWYEDLRTGIVTISEGLAGMLGTPRHTMHLDIRAYDHPEDHARVLRTLADYDGEDGYASDHRILCADGRVRAVRERVRTVYDDRGVAIARVGTLLDISDLKEREAHLSELALCDALTRLPNRTAFEERLESAIARCSRNERRCGVLFIDLDGFKMQNDRHGHAFGDRILIGVADRLSRHVRASDTVARFGGDEFVVLIDDLYTDDAAVDAARKILRSLDDPFSVDGTTVSIRASIGVATYPGSGATARDVMERADHEMYVVKRNGGCGVKLAAQKETAREATEKRLCQTPSSTEPHRFVTLESVLRSS